MSFESINTTSLFFDTRVYDKELRGKLEIAQMEFLDRMPKEKEEEFFSYLNFITKEKRR